MIFFYDFLFLNLIFYYDSPVLTIRIFYRIYVVSNMWINHHLLALQKKLWCYIEPEIWKSWLIQIDAENVFWKKSNNVIWYTYKNTIRQPINIIIINKKKSKCHFIKSATILNYPMTAENNTKFPSTYPKMSRTEMNTNRSSDKHHTSPRVKTSHPHSSHIF